VDIGFPFKLKSRYGHHNSSLLYRSIALRDYPRRFNPLQGGIPNYSSNDTFEKITIKDLLCDP
jgi:hypothetical protein